jgi:glycosyltransferase involved in cell wall biosynthesis
MNILMVTNTYTPHVGGVARSVAGFASAYRQQGHRVLVVAPIFDDVDDTGPDVIRVPALQNVNGSDFSVVLPIPGYLTTTVRDFAPHVVHSHHPFLLGSTAMRLSRALGVPLIFTHHTMYEQYTHYVPGDCPLLQRFVIQLSTNYANLCERVFAPSESIRDVLLGRGVQVPVSVVPTGVDFPHFAQGDGARFRRRFGIPPGAFLVGHVGRLAPEKNLDFLARAVCRFLTEPGGENGCLLVAGEGPSDKTIRQIATHAGVAERLYKVGVLDSETLVDAYHAMDVFAFASKSETQGMVLTEAMAAGTPVVALDAPGVREVVVDRENGRLLHEADEVTFAGALTWVSGASSEQRRRLETGAVGTGERFSMVRTAKIALAHYQSLKRRPNLDPEGGDEAWQSTLQLIRTEWDMVKGVAAAAEAALITADEPEGDNDVRAR